ncbi:cation-translocating P-type ATPase [Leptospira sp. 96542]|nr:cation-translocating P-type ATPase [Leptospira sp. 96542]
MSNKIESFLASGLTEKQVIQNRKKFGPNEIVKGKKTNLLFLMLRIVTEPMIVLLLIISFVYLMLGDRGEAILLLFSVLVIISITFYQEKKTETALSALRSLATPRTNVIRNGSIYRIDGRDVVVGDLILLSEGDRISADSLILSAEPLFCDESLLTGESMPVSKFMNDKVYSGALVASGGGVCRVEEIGSRTEIGKIGKQIDEEKVESTLLEKEVSRLVKWLFLVSMFFCVCLALYFGFAQSKWLKGLLAGLTLAIGLLPEELPLVLTIFFAFGAYRLSRKNVLVRKSSIIETLGAATVLCSDKTGTITKNKMSLEYLVTNIGINHLLNKDIELSSDIKDSLHAALLACKQPTFDPMEIAIKNSFEFFNLKDDLKLEWVKEFPLTNDHLTMVQVYKSDEQYKIFAKGSPEAVFDLCNLDEAEKNQWIKETNILAKNGYRILGVASGKTQNLPNSKKDAEYNFLGLLGFLDPIRDSVPADVQSAREAGVRILMITGDYPETAKNIAIKIGLTNPTEVVIGEDISKLSDYELKKILLSCNVYSRVSPLDKWRIVKLLKEESEIVAMTGDGVNDAPALRSAHIGVAMGERGTDVAREASDIVLMNDSFSSILEAIKTGRHIYDNLRKALGYIIAVHLPIVGITFFPLLFDWPVLVLSAVQIVFLELVIDPTCTLVFEKEAPEANLMKRKPRNRTSPLLDKRLFISSIVQGLFSFLSVILCYWVIYHFFFSVNDDLQLVATTSFVTLVISNLFLILANRSFFEPIWISNQKPNLILPYVFFGTIALLCLAIYVPYLREIFHFSVLSWQHWLLSVLIAFLGVFLYDLLKIVLLRRLLQNTELDTTSPN